VDTMKIPIKTCPKCGIEHQKSGEFCSRRCANRRAQSDITRLRIREGVVRNLRERGIVPRSERPQPERIQPDPISGIRRRKRDWPERVLAPNGYWLIKVPEDYQGSRYGRGRLYAYEHRVIMEKHIGRLLVKGEVIDHINEDKHDQRIENLQVLTPSEHAKKTIRVQREKRGPLPTNTQCDWCRNPFRVRPGKLTSNRWLFCCRQCQFDYQKNIGFHWLR
jgi:hypothetical protein